MQLNKTSLARLIKFSLAGGINTVVTYAFYAGLIWLGVHFNPALAGEYIVGIVLGFLLNRIWTFSDRRHLDHPFRKYLATYALVFLVNLVLLNALVWAGLHPLPGQAVALGLATLASYLLQKNWVFKSRQKQVIRQQAAGAMAKEEPVLETSGVDG